MAMVKEIFSYFLVFAVGFVVGVCLNYSISKSYYKEAIERRYRNEDKQEENNLIGGEHGYL